MARSLRAKMQATRFSARKLLSVLFVIGYFLAYSAVDSLHQIYHSALEGEAHHEHVLGAESSGHALTSSLPTETCVFLAHLSGLSSSPALAANGLEVELTVLLTVATLEVHKEFPLKRADLPLGPRGPPVALS